LCVDLRLLADGCWALSHCTCVHLVLATFSLLGTLRLIPIATNTVNSVQAWGQAIFLPMLIIGGVAIPVRMLKFKLGPHLAAFLPGRYAVYAMDAAVMGVRKAGVSGTGKPGVWFALLALTFIGAAGFLAGVTLFRWE